MLPEKPKGERRVKQKRYVEMTRQEWRLATEGLNYELVGDHFTEGRRKPFWSAGCGSPNTMPLYTGASLYLWYRLAPFFTSRRYAL